MLMTRGLMLKGNSISLLLFQIFSLCWIQSMAVYIKTPFGDLFYIPICSRKWFLLHQNRLSRVQNRMRIEASKNKIQILNIRLQARRMDGMMLNLNITGNTGMHWQKQYASWNSRMKMFYSQIIKTDQLTIFDLSWIKYIGQIWLIDEIKMQAGDTNEWSVLFLPKYLHSCWNLSKT